MNSSTRAQCKQTTLYNVCGLSFLNTNKKVFFLIKMYFKLSYMIESFCDCFIMECN